MNTSLLSFGSCNRQNLPQNYWMSIQRHHPKYFIWAGDAVYSKGNSIEKLTSAFQNMNKTANPYYYEFSKDKLIDGIWDDHDYGVNDGGRDAPFKKKRQNEFVNFLNSMPKKPRNLESLYNQEGIYHDLDINHDGLKIKVIFLDTRTFRDPHYIRSLGEYHFPFSALLASAIRLSYITLGFGKNFNGDILGKAQWMWLRNVLIKSEADVTIIVSSIQVMTTNPVLESWGHFPLEKEKLFNTLKEINPKNLIFISGDVHFSEISETTYIKDDGTIGFWNEITSSGLTHTCADNIITKFLCPMMVNHFYSHRKFPNQFFIGKNFGTVRTTRTGPENWKLEFLISSLEDTSMNEPKLLHQINVEKSSSIGKIVSVNIGRFSSIQTGSLYSWVAFFLFIFISLIYLRKKTKKISKLS